MNTKQKAAALLRRLKKLTPKERKEWSAATATLFKKRLA